MTLITPEGESFTELTPAERAYLKALLSKCANRTQLQFDYGVDRDWMRNSPYMPDPLFSWGRDWPVYDAHEVVIEYNLSRERASNKPWTHKDIDKAMRLWQSGLDYKDIAVVLNRTTGAVRSKLTHTRRQLKGKAA
jgi:hypothetical protein